MKKRKDIMDKIAYICLCIGTFGLVALLRVIITEAIRQALQDEEK